MLSSKLPVPISLTGCTTQSDVVDRAYQVFMQTLGDRRARPNLFGKFIYVSFEKRVNSKPQIFWHLIGLADGTAALVQCKHEGINGICGDNCVTKAEQVTLVDGIRNICCHRAVRVNWISTIIDLANRKDPNVQVWFKDKKLHLRIIHETADYVLIFG